METGDASSGRGGRVRLTAPGIILLAAGLLATIPLLLSDETLADRAAVDEATFNQEPHEFRLVAGSTVVDLQGPEEEVAWLRDWLAANGFPPRGDESGLEFALRAARFVQKTLRFGQGELSTFRGWGPRRILEAAAAGDRFYCDSYARLFSDIVLTGGEVARPVWMAGHVTAEIYSRDDHTWVLVDPMFNFYATDDGELLSVTGIRAHLYSGRRFVMHSIAEPAGLDEPSRTVMGHEERMVFGGSQFTVFDSVVSFNSGHAHIVVPAISLANPDWPEGTSPAVVALRVAAPALMLVGGLLIAAGRWTSWRRASAAGEGAEADDDADGGAAERG